MYTTGQEKVTHGQEKKQSAKAYSGIAQRLEFLETEVKITDKMLKDSE